ncbi:MAG TPA: M48 family metallopeptidase [Thermodesulfobacteriota bacterium]|nr:M48 family metallopeptidase [Thermodesulfobacteriota bacterium]
MEQRLRILIALLACVLVASCATVPITERRAIHLVSSSELTSMSLQEYDKVLKQSTLSRDAGKVQMVKNVGARIAKATEDFLREKGLGAEADSFKWEFNLIEDDKTVNAWCMPGGKVAVFTGILPVTRDETGLAVVMGHEIAHAVAQHGNERMSQGLLAQMGGVALSVALSTQAAATQGLFMAAYGAGAQMGFLLPYSRLQEAEADQIGLILMARAGYDPREAIPFWSRMNAAGGSRTPQFLSTHPAPQTRIKEIEAHLPEAMKYYKAQ